MTAVNWLIHVDFHFHYLSWSIILVIHIENKAKQKGEGEIDFYKNHYHRIAFKKTYLLPNQIDRLWKSYD